MTSLLLLLSSGWAYDLSGDDWSWQTEPIAQPVLVDASSFPPATGSTAEIEQAVLDGISEWNGLGNLELTMDGTPSNWPDGGHITLVWDPDPATGAVVASAAGWSWGETIFSCEVFFWSANDWGPIDWAVQEDPWTTDIAEVTTHEVGHCLGFDHSDDWGAIMRPAARGWRGLDQDDEDGLVAMYPPCSDADGDGFSCEDCDDADATVHPGATESCNGRDDDCNGAIDEVASSAVSFGAITHTSAERTGSSWLTLFDVEADTALLSFSQALVLDTEQWVSFTVIDVTAGQPRTRTVRVARFDAGTGSLESPPMGVTLSAGHRYLIGAGIGGAGRYSYQSSAGTAAHGLVPGGARWESYAPALASEDQPHGAHQPRMTLHLVDQDLDQDGVTAFCGDCDDSDSSATGPGDCQPVDPQGPVDPTDTNDSTDEPDDPEGGCSSSTLSIWLPALRMLSRR